VAEIRTVAVIGAGIAGRDIARAAALAGFRTILQDILPSKLRKAEAELRDRSARLEYASTVEEAAREADLVIEAVPDEQESKLEIFTLLDKICRPATILATITATLSVSEIASVTYRPDKCIGMKFVVPVEKMTSLELVRGDETSEETLKACEEAGRKILAANSRE
jgi:3-hydroxybutyryl-CoA dehydrogenase